MYKSIFQREIEYSKSTIDSQNGKGLKPALYFYKTSDLFQDGQKFFKNFSTFPLLLHAEHRICVGSDQSPTLLDSDCQHQINVGSLIRA